MQNRGIIRREKLRAAARQLLNERDISEVTFADIAATAGVPKSSSYHFYANSDDLYAELASYYGVELLGLLSAKPERDLVTQWHDIVDILIDRAMQFYRSEAAARQLFISGKTSPIIKQKDRSNDSLIAKALLEMFNHYFDVPDFAMRDEVFFIWVELVDTVFTVSQMKHGDITAEYANEARRVAKAYLGTYLPVDLPLQPVET
ncbi:TetR/AcrR family transcriptional regulator [Vibrio europaeus]|uniref:TetR/AcrR family transcriptional regulator n=1 Tax=Vibrio europaeus TaxID=300876 RepID=A0AAE7B065_9VIBR|nr:TetR/AcrR family transcriptional regulator [Vibrio europaeus]QJY38894.1 TetR/AcrR family transcriptional regulator [Vibrio europaeus]